VNRLRGEPNANKHSVPDPDGSDARLVAQSKLGDAQAFALLYRRYVDRIYDYSRQRLATREDAEDATQATFMRALKSIGTCREGELFAGRLFAIARNVIYDSYASGRIRVVTLDDSPDIEDPGRSPEDEAEAADWVARLDQLRRDCLKHDDRDLLDLRLEGLNVDLP
jgi:RNA polymerase sigma-70 factor (ECF subfamily)